MKTPVGAGRQDQDQAMRKEPDVKRSPCPSHRSALITGCGVWRLKLGHRVKEKEDEEEKKAPLRAQELLQVGLGLHKAL